MYVYQEDCQRTLELQLCPDMLLKDAAFNLCVPQLDPSSLMCDFELATIQAGSIGLAEEY